MSLRGSGVALITPFKANGEIDFEALANLIESVSTNGIDYLVVLGTTAETATLSETEQKQVIDFVLENNKANLPVVLGLGGNNTASIIEKIKSTDLSRFRAILSVSPYYSKPTQEGIYQHYAAIAAVCPIDIILYNVPGRTASNISPETVVRLAEDFENIVAIKEAAGSLEQFMNLVASTPKDFDIISGDDAIAMPSTLLGGSGVISVIGQALPLEFSNMINAALNGDLEQANSLQYRFMELTKLIFEEGNPTGVKNLMQETGICTDTVRLPLVSCSNTLNEKIKSAYLRFKK